MNPKLSTQTEPSEVALPTDKTLVDLLGEQVQETPYNIAVRFEDQQLTFRELDEQSNQLAHYLRRCGVGTETLVPVCLDRSITMIVGLLGIMKAGGAYVPVDPQYPEDRIRYILSDVNGQVVIGAGASAPAEETPNEGVNLNYPPMADAKLGRDPSGSIAWFIADPNRPGKFLQLT